MAITIRDVAKKLNLSITTVSRALDGYSDVAQETRLRVIETAQQMGYTPNRAARQLRRQRSDTIGYILPTNTPRFSDPFYSEFISGLGDEAAEGSYDLLISSAPSGKEAEQNAYQRWAHSRKVDGFIVNRIWQSDWRVRFLSSQKMPFVTLERSSDLIDCPSVQVESKQSFVELVNHISKRGYRRFAYIGGPTYLVIHADRLEGFIQGLALNQIPLDPALIVNSDLTSEGGYKAATRLLWLPDPPDAFVCINDETAFGVLHAAREAGRIVGANLAVAGFDGVQESKFSQPTLTTLDQPLYDIARQLVRMLLAEIDEQPIPDRHVVVKPILQIRESTEKR